MPEKPKKDKTYKDSKKTESKIKEKMKVEIDEKVALPSV